MMSVLNRSIPCPFMHIPAECMRIMFFDAGLSGRMKQQFVEESSVYEGAPWKNLLPADM